MAEIFWYMSDAGTPTHQYLGPSIPTFVEPYPKALWRMDNINNIYHEYLPESITTFVPPYPKDLWRIDSKINNGAPYHEYLPVAATIENNTYGYYNGRPIYRIFCNGKVIDKIYYKK